MRAFFSGRRGASVQASAGAGAAAGGHSRGLALLAVGLLLCGVAVPIARRVFVGTGLATVLIALPSGPSGALSKSDVDERKGEVSFTDEEWKRRLTPGQYAVLRKEVTERRFSSPLLEEERTGTFTCAGCGSPLFPSSSKFESGTGWPSFFQPLPGAVTEVPDYSIPFMPRTEVRCAKCQGHTGHVFNDGPKPTGLRYCMNGLALGFVPDKEQAAV